jgi:hypothetical protein
MASTVEESTPPERRITARRTELVPMGVIMDSGVE